MGRLIETGLLLALLAPAAAFSADEPAILKETPSPSAASAPASQSDLEALAAEVRRLKLEVGIPDVEYKSFEGLGPAASKVYYVPKGLSIGGYGEIVYQHYEGVRDSSGLLLRDNTDIRRFVVYVGYRFSDLVVFNGELEIEHAREAEIEFAYLDFLLTKPVRLRVGSMLVPIGLVNEFHEPPFFHGVNRPDLESVLIPTSWRENGLGLHGQVAGLRYKAYLLTGLDVSRLSSGSAWLRGARGHGANALAGSFAVVVNADYEIGPGALGASFYRGQAGHGLSGLGGQAIGAEVLLAEAHGQLAWRRLQLRGIYALGTLGDAGVISERLGLAGAGVLGSRVRGGYLEAAYDVFGLLLPSSDQSLSPFVRFEAMNLHDQVPAGGEQDPALDARNLTVGLTYKPIPTVVAKADVQFRQSAVARSAAQQVNLGVGFVF